MLFKTQALLSEYLNFKMIQLKHKDLERCNKATEKHKAQGKYGPKKNQA